MIDVVDLTKSFGAHYALRGVTLRIPAGAAFCLVGPNGAGKTTFLRILSTLSRPTSGQVHIAGTDLSTGAESVRSRIGVIAHATFLYDELTAEENLHFYAKLYDLEEPAARIATLLDQVGLGARGQDRVRTYSRGMQQRLSIARAMLHDPDILFLDEPYTGLDQHGARLLTEWLGELRSSERTLVLVTHDLAQGYIFADRLAMFRSGRLVFDRQKSDLSLTEFQEAYFQHVSAGHAN